ncbi:MAG: hypothetical protein GOVbin3264_31 [Prokaryotic dsDNA virus sp.]|nr:MAG: hypothetical protein GOVbin3264_31 [Prokaryotic dsDNA virus sp.]|tara:strand:- start:3036 stop:3233 length:198 start_codon:yes stop_codon:yes gene_type:complete
MKSPIDKTVEMADELSKDLSGWVKPMLVTAISKLDEYDHERLYKALFNIEEPRDPNFLKSDINQN